MINPPVDRVRGAPFITDLSAYTSARLRADLQSGITVAIFAIPQVMAYALLMGVPPIHGLYAAMVTSIIAALWGSSAFVNTGPTNSASLLTAAALIPLAGNGHYLEAIFVFTILVGIFRCLLGLSRMGLLVNYVPESAFLGFTVGVGLMIALGPLHHLLGVEKSTHAYFPYRVYEVLGHVKEINFSSLSIGLGTLVFMLGCDRWSRILPTALIAISISTLAVHALPLQIPVVESIPRGLPRFHTPEVDWSLIPSLVIPAFAVAAIGLVEAVSIGQILAVKHKRHMNFNQEFFGQGISHIVGAFFQGIPGSGSFSRSTLIERAGGETRFANVYYGFFTAIALLLIPAILEKIPIAALAGLLLYIGIQLVDLRRLRRLWKTSKHDAVILVVTFLSTVFVTIEFGLLIGIIIAAGIVLNRAGELRMFELIPSPSGRFDEKPYDPGSEHEPGDLVALTVYGELFYGVSHQLLEQLNEIAQTQQPKFMVLRIRRAYSIDYSCWNAIFDFAEAFDSQGGKLILAGIRSDISDLIAQARMQEVLPSEQVYPQGSALLQSFKQALDYATQQVKDSDRLQGCWQDYIENPVLLTEQQIEDINQFLKGDSIPGTPKE